MALYLDSALPDEAEHVETLGYVQGITTNPALMGQAGRPPLETLKALLDNFSGEVWYQVSAAEAAQRREEARAAFELAPEQVIVKLPATAENAALAAALRSEGIVCAFTASYSPMQAYVAAQCGARYVAVYFNRAARLLGDGAALVQGSRAALQGTSTELLAASLKSVEECSTALLAGAQHLTMPLKLLLALSEHELTQHAIDEFAAAQLKNT